MKRQPAKPAQTLTHTLSQPRTTPTRRLLAGGLLMTFAALLGPGCSQEDPSDLLSLAASAIASGDARTAASRYQDAATLSPSDSLIRWQLAKALLRIRDGSGAEKQIRAATRLGIDDERTRPALAHALFLQGKYAETLDLSIGGFGKLPAAKILAYQVRAHIELGDLVAAQALLTKATKLSRYSADVFFAQAELAFAHDDLQSALEALQKVQLLERDYPYAPARLGEIAMARGDAASAECYFSEATELRYGPWRDQLNRGIARLQQGKREQAREDAKALLAQLPDEAEVRLFADQAFADEDDRAQAQDAPKRLAERRPDQAPAQPTPDPGPDRGQAPVPQGEAPHEIILDVVSLAGVVEGPAPAGGSQEELPTLPGPVSVAATAMEGPRSTLSQPRITGIIPTVVSVQVLPPDPVPDPPEAEGPPAATPTEVGLSVGPAADEPIEEKPAASPNAETGPEAIALSKVRSFVLDWAAAWSRQDVDAYLAHYAEGFRPASGTSHTVWRDQRRERLMRPKSISVEVSELEVIPQDARHVQARFVQDYRANHYRDRVTKTLDLMREGGEWRIVRELNL
jgi:Flp pilus assembly protein TadD